MFRKRYYHYPSPIAIDRFNTRVLSALSAKLSRDYMGFFGTLVKTYSRGEQKKKLDSTVTLVKKSIMLLDNMISMNQVSKKDVQNLIIYIEEINQSRDEFLYQAEQNKSLEAKMQKVSEGTGILPEDLNVTKQIVQKGASAVQKRTKEGVIPFIKRAMPGTLALGGELGKGLATALLGPFVPAAGMLGTLAKGAWGVGSGIRERRRLGQEEKLSRQLAPMSGALQTSTFKQLARGRAEHPLASSFTGVSQRRPTSRRQSKEEMVLPLTYFFDKKAHKTKWTKELLNRFKSLEKKLGQSRAGGGLLDMLSLGGLTKKFGLLGAALLPLLGQAGILLGLGAASIYASTQLRDLGALSLDYWNILKGLKGHEERQLALQDKFRKKEIGTLADKMLVERPRDPLGALDALKKKGGIDSQTFKEVENVLIFDRALSKILPGLQKDTSDVESITKKIRGGLTQKDEFLETMPTKIKDPFYTGDRKEKDMGMLGVQKAIEKMHETISRQQGSGVKGSSLGDPFGVGDPFMIPWSNGQVLLGDD